MLLGRMRSVVAQERKYWSEQITLGLVCRAIIETVRLISTDYKSCRRFMSSVYVHHGRLDFVVTFWFLIEKSGKYVSIDVSAQFVTLVHHEHHRPLDDELFPSLSPINPYL